MQLFCRRAATDLRFGLVHVLTPNLSPNALNTDLTNFAFLLPIEVDFSERHENHPPGIFGLAQDPTHLQRVHVTSLPKNYFFESAKILYSNRYVYDVFVARLLEALKPYGKKAALFSIFCA